MSHLSVGLTNLADRRGWLSSSASTVGMTMGSERTFSVTLIKTGRGIPQVEVGAYRYTGDWLPEVGETIAVRRADDPDGVGAELQGFVTKVNPVADTPISVVEVEDQRLDDNVVVQPGESPQA
jgi:hypothetical protein